MRFYTESDSKTGIMQGGCLRLCQAKPALKQPNLNKLGDAGGHKGKAKPTQHKPIFESRAVYFLLIATMILFSSCSQRDWNSSMVDDEMIEYKLVPGQYAVVVILNDKVTIEVAKRAARHRAAELAVSGGYRYFLIQSETQTSVMKQQASLEGDGGEMFIEGDFRNGPLAAAPITATAFPALRVVFQCFDKKPKGKSINACNLTDCSNTQR